MADVEHRPTVLLVGQGEAMQTELGEALRRHGISVAGCATAELETAIRVYAPDLVVLIGDAAVRGGAAVIRRMAGNRGTDVLPIAVVSNDAAIKQSDKRFRSGAVAVVPRGAGADAIARRLAELAVEVPERPGMLRGRLSEENLQDVVELVSDDTKTGILSLRTPDGPVDAVPIVVETEGAGAHNMERVLDRLREAMEDASSLEFEFHEASGGRLSALPGPIEPEEVDLSALRGVRIVVLDSNELRAEKLAQVLMQRGVQIAAADFSPAVIPRIREIDPQIVVLDSSAVGGQGVDFVRALRKDTQLRWASMLVVRWEDFWPSASNGATPDIAQLATRIVPLVEQDHVLARRVEDEVDFDTRLELVGPGRLLRALGSVPGVRHVALAGHKRNVEIDIADNSIVGAYATLNEGTTETLQGMPALLAAWGMTAGRVSVREQDLPSVANIMMPVDEALGVVSHQLAFEDGSNAGIAVDAETVPPQLPEVEEHATVPPGENDPGEFDEARTMSPPRFAQRRAANGPTPFPAEEVPTNKVAQMLGRVETKPHPIPTARGAMEANVGSQHVDHAVTRSKKATQMGLAPVFESLREGHDDALNELQELEELEIPEPRAPTPPPPPPPPQFQASARPPMFEEAYDIEPLATSLEGATMVAPPPESRGLPAWIQGLLLVTLIAGVGVAGWLLWSQSGSGELASDEPGKGPITGSVNGLDSEGTDTANREADPEQTAATDEAPDTNGGDVEPESETPSQPVEAKQAEAPEPKPAREATAPSESKALPPAKPEQPAVPTQGLPRDPAKASDVLVHRSLPLIRQGKLRQAQATLDRAWELDPRNPQAMAGYARLYIKRKNGDEAVKWARKAVRKRAKRAPYHVLYGDALTLQGKTTEARAAYRRALSIDPTNSTARSRLASSKARAAK